MRRAILLLTIGLGLSNLYGLETRVVLKVQNEEDRRVLSVLGYSPQDALASFGPPRQVFSHRGAEPWMDFVVFYWDSDNYYLFWWDSRVWQIRFDNRFRGTFMGLTMGMSEGQVLGLLGQPMNETGPGEMRRWTIEEAGYPRELGLVFANGRLADMYIYRADF